MALGQALLTKPPRVQQPQTQVREVLQSKSSTRSLDQQLKLEQSLEVVQTLLGASIGCLSFLRGLLPEECFVEKRYGGSSSTAVSYRSFTSDLDDEAFFKKGNNGTRIKRLRRGYSCEADQLLDWLEIGIFDALRRGYLKAVQLAIYPDDKHPDTVVESYTFSFTYREKDDGPSISLKVTDMHGHGVTANDANKNLQLMIRRLIVITQNLPPLPDKRWLTIRLHYLDGTPKDYDPPNFYRLSPTAFPLRIRENESKAVEKLDCGELNAGYHTVALKVSSLSEVDPEERPRRRRGSRFITMDTDIVQPHLRSGRSSEDEKKGSDTHRIPNTNEGSPAIISPPCEVGFVEERRVAPNTSHNTQMPPKSGPTSRLPGRETQERLAIRGMLVPSDRGSEIPETQPCNLGFEQTQNPPVECSPRPSTNTDTRLRPENLATQPQKPPRPPRADKQATTADSRQLPEQRISLRTLTGRHLSRPQDVSATIPSTDTNLSEEAPSKIYKLKMLDTKKAELVKNKVITEAKGKGVTRAVRADDHQIVCECGSKELSEDMICCDLCECWQHTECYGFTSTQDPRIPDNQVCYSCLLSKFEERLLEEMRGLALFRKAVKLVWDKGSFPATNRAFSNGLGCDLPTASQITRRLLEEGFIAQISTTRTGRQKKTVNGSPVKYRVVKTPEMAKIKEVQYFDPLVKISHHFENPSPPENLHKPVLKDTPAVKLSEPPGYDESGVEDSQAFESHFEEAIVISESNHGVPERPADMDSTADEEELPRSNAYQTEPNSTIPAHETSKTSSRVTSSFPHKSIGQSSATPEMIQDPPEAPSQPRVNVSAVSFDVYVGYDSEG
ncbi:unnamed protein product [Tuber melanosporum]|uniref:(Perigord truffle) hypothetical protein n=1 Tax=Tuber melanosporum (strain Mel28) TaxID=656061 RepID=D5GAJ2_TUBMM|nr:uncharacterized protein GSTUM_00003611001 [Tuber melanosporum]CAZ81535.1 unnamed protein product [Tuber melanosporum]